MLFVRLAGTLAVIATVALISTSPRLSNHNRPGTFGTAFAQATKVSTASPFWIKIGRHRDYNINTKKLDEKWNVHKEWFDIERGDVSFYDWNSTGTADTALRSIHLPSGDQYVRYGKSMVAPDGKPFGENRLDYLHHNKKVLPRTLEAIRNSMVDPDALRDPGLEEVEKSSATGLWRGKSVTILTVVEKPKYNIGVGGSLVRTRYFVDPQTERFIGIERDCQYYGHDDWGWTLMYEEEIRYEKPAPDVFDLKPLEEGASERREQWLTDEGDGYIDKEGKLVGGPTPQWLTNHPGQDWQTYRYTKPVK